MRKGCCSMKKQILLFFFCCLALCSASYATSIRLQNDSSMPLRAVIRGSDGSFLGDILVQPQADIKWTDTYNPLAHGNNPPQGPNRSQTPLTVIWYCMNGNNYGANDNVSTGALVKASQSVGNKYCELPKVKKNDETDQNQP
jgi:hypothetical protein